MHRVTHLGICITELDGDVSNELIFKSDSLDT